MKQLVLEHGPRLRRAILLALAAGVPLFFWRGLNEPFNVPKLALLVAGTALVAAIRGVELLQGRSWDGLGRAAVPALLLIVPLSLAWGFSSYRGWSLLGEYGGFQGVVPYFVVIVFGVLVADAFVGRAASLAWAITISGGVAAAYAVLQRFGLDPFPWDFTTGPGGDGSTLAISTLGNENFAGSYFAMTLPVTAVVALTDPGRRRWAILFGLLGAAALFETRSQGPWVAGIAGMVVVAGWYLSARYKHARILAALAAAGFVLLTFGTVIASIYFPSSRFLSHPNIRVRGDWAEAAAAMALDRPVVGHGPDTFTLLGVQYRPPEDAALDGYGFSNDPHSVLMSFLAGAGVVGAVGFLGLAGWSTRKALSAKVDLMVGGFFGMVVAYFVQSMVSIDQISLRVGLWAAVGGLIAASAGAPQPVAKAGRQRSRQTRRASTRSVTQPLKRPWAVGLIGLAALAALFWTGRFVAADAGVQHAINLFQEREFAEGDAAFTSARSTREDIHYRRLHGLWAGDAGLELLERPADGDGDASAEGLLRDLPDLYAYIDRIPDLRAIRVYASQLERWAELGDADLREEALALYLRVIEFDPLNPLARADAAELLLELGRPREASEVIGPAVEIVTRDYPGMEVPGPRRSAVLDVGAEVRQEL